MISENLFKLFLESLGTQIQLKKPTFVAQIQMLCELRNISTIMRQTRHGFFLPFLTKVYISLCDEPGLVVRIQGESIGHQLCDCHGHSFHIYCLYAAANIFLNICDLQNFTTLSSSAKSFLLWNRRWPNGEVFCCDLIHNIVLKETQELQL